jgi:hypothetical protein
LAEAKTEIIKNFIWNKYHAIFLLTDKIIRNTFQKSKNLPRQWPIVGNFVEQSYHSINHKNPEMSRPFDG